MRRGAKLIGQSKERFIMNSYFILISKYTLFMYKVYNYGLIVDINVLHDHVNKLSWADPEGGRQEVQTPSGKFKSL